MSPVEPPLPLTDLCPVDPQSPQADELRHLLNVVSGRAPDSEGNTSEPLVKEELAIVEFLTAKSNPPNKQRATGRPARGGEDQTPVDLLLGLAKTRSGRRAAEEEKRQLRLQQQMDAQEQQAAAQRGSNGSSSSPWDYVAPAMPGLDVQQPFAANGQRRAPRPLQPPPPKRGSTQEENAWSANLFEALSNQTPMPPQPTQPDVMQQQPMQQPLSVDQYQYMDLGNPQLPSPSQAMNPFDQTMLYTQDGSNQFGQANMESFNFSDLGFSTGLTPKDTEGGSFNPFALAQNQVREEG